MCTIDEGRKDEIVLRGIEDWVRYYKGKCRWMKEHGNSNNIEKKSLRYRKLENDRKELRRWKNEGERKKLLMQRYS